MKIFISWSGPRSGAVAEALKEYLPVINNGFDPWLSSADIPKGSRSTAEIAEALAAAKAGIICLTPNNLTAPWILYEAGGVAKTVDKPLACTLLIDLEPSSVSKPLGDFQHTRLTEKELLQLVKTLNRSAGENTREDAQIEKSFKLCWPELKEKLDALPNDGSTDQPQRTPADLLAEILDTVRRTQQDTDILKKAEQGTVRGIAEISARLSNLIPSVSNTLAASGSPASVNAEAFRAVGMIPMSSLVEPVLVPEAKLPHFEGYEPNSSMYGLGPSQGAKAAGRRSHKAVRRRKRKQDRE